MFNLLGVNTSISSMFNLLGVNTSMSSRFNMLIIVYKYK